MTVQTRIDSTFSSGTDLLILDESLVALDPRTLRRSLDFGVEEAPTVLIIAHP
jgi:ABC-type multidrug transport system fused ATPase/permease subunit